MTISDELSRRAAPEAETTRPSPWRWQRGTRAFWFYLAQRSRGLLQRRVVRLINHVLEVWAISQVANLSMFYTAAALTAADILVSVLQGSILSWHRNLILRGYTNSRNLARAVSWVASTAFIIAVLAHMKGKAPDAAVEKLMIARTLLLIFRQIVFHVTAPSSLDQRVFIPPAVNVVNVGLGVAVTASALNLSAGPAFLTLIWGHAGIAILDYLITMVATYRFTRRAAARAATEPTVVDTEPLTPAIRVRIGASLLFPIMEAALFGVVVTKLLATDERHIVITALSAGYLLAGRPYSGLSLDVFKWLRTGRHDVAAHWVAQADQAAKQIALVVAFALVVALAVFAPLRPGAAMLVGLGVLAAISRRLLWQRLALTGKSIDVSTILLAAKAAALAAVLLAASWHEIRLPLWVGAELLTALPLIWLSKDLQVCWQARRRQARRGLRRRDETYSLHEECQAMIAALRMCELTGTAFGALVVHSVASEFRKAGSAGLVPILQGLSRSSDLVIALDDRRAMVVSSTCAIHPRYRRRVVEAAHSSIEKLTVVNDRQGIVDLLGGKAATVWLPTHDRSEAARWLESHLKANAKSAYGALAVWYLDDAGVWTTRSGLGTGHESAELYHAAGLGNRDPRLLNPRARTELDDGRKSVCFRPFGVVLAVIVVDRVDDLVEALRLAEAQYRRATMALEHARDDLLSLETAVRMEALARYLVQREVIERYSVKPVQAKESSPAGPLLGRFYDERGKLCGIYIHLKEKRLEARPLEAVLHAAPRQAAA